MTSKTSDQENESRRGSVENPAEPRFLVIGRITKPHGVGGEVRVIPHTEMPERFSWLEHVYVGEANPQKVGVESVRFHKSLILLKLAGYNDRNAAEILRNEWLLVTEEEAIPLEDGEYFLYQLVGLQVYSDAGESLGVLVDVIETGANNVFVVEGALGQILVPDIEEVVLEIDFENGRMTVHLLPGLLP